MRSTIWATTLLGLTLAGCGHRPAALPAPAPADLGEVPTEVLTAEAPADSTAAPAEVLPPLPIDLADFDLPIHDTEQVRRFLDLFQNRHPKRFAGYLEAKGRYEAMILAKLRERGMPEDLIYLALIESGFSPKAYSHAHASGIWQFIEGTGKRYGLEISSHVDERRDPVRSTDAALRYLQDLHRRFGSWYLAAAAYNTGEGRVERVLKERAGGARGSDSLFWAISDGLPRETRDYVPLMVAAAILGKYPDRFGFGHVRPQAPETYDVVEVPDETDLEVIASAAGTDVATIEKLNPQLLRKTTPPGRAMKLRVPAGRGDAFARAYAAIPAERRVSRRSHVVARGETLSGIALRYGTTVEALRRANKIDDPSRVAAGRRLTLPAGLAEPAPVAGAQPAPGPSPAAGESGRKVTEPVAVGQGTGAAPRAAHTVRPGDSLWALARKHGVSVAELRAWNGLDASDTIRPGQVLELQAPLQVVSYTVQPGDSLWAIARRHGVSVGILAEWNRLTPDSLIRPGDALEIRVAR